MIKNQKILLLLLLLNFISCESPKFVDDPIPGEYGIRNITENSVSFFYNNKGVKKLVLGVSTDITLSKNESDIISIEIEDFYNSDNKYLDEGYIFSKENIEGGIEYKGYISNGNNTVFLYPNIYFPDDNCEISGLESNTWYLLRFSFIMTEFRQGRNVTIIFKTK